MRKQTRSLGGKRSTSPPAASIAIATPPGSSPTAFSWITVEMMQLLVDNLVDYAIVLLDLEGTVLTWSAAAERIHGWQANEILGGSFSRFHTPEQLDQEIPRLSLQAARKEGVVEQDALCLRKDGSRYWATTKLVALTDTKGDIRGFGQITRDLTQQTSNAAEMQARAGEIFEMATVPIVQVWEGVVLVPLIGILDSVRTQQLTERLLQRVTDTDSPIVVLDITGVPTIDTQIAQHLIEMISAVRLLGAEVVLTGVRPVIAQTLVHLGIDLSHIVTRSSLAAGLRVALDSLKLVVTTKDVKQLERIHGNV